MPVRVAKSRQSQAYQMTPNQPRQLGVGFGRLRRFERNNIKQSSRRKASMGREGRHRRLEKSSTGETGVQVSCSHSAKISPENCMRQALTGSCGHSSQFVLPEEQRV